MFPPRKTWVVTLGLSTPESSVCTWYVWPRYLMLWLKPTNVLATGGIAGSYRPGPGAASRAGGSDVHVDGLVHAPPQESPRHGGEAPRRVRHEEPVLRLPRAA